MSISIDSVRVGKKYSLRNIREYHEFRTVKALGEKDFLCEDIHTLERYLLSDLTAYGKGNDYEFFELEK